MGRDCQNLVRLRHKQGALGRLFSFTVIHVALIDQANFQLLDRQDVAIAHNQIDVVERDALGLQTIIDDFLKKPTSMLLARYPLLLDGIGNLAITQQAGADVVIVGVNANDVGVILTHRVVVLTGKYESLPKASSYSIGATCIM